MVNLHTNIIYLFKSFSIEIFVVQLQLNSSKLFKRLLIFYKPMCRWDISRNLKEYQLETYMQIVIANGIYIMESYREMHLYVRNLHADEVYH